MSRAYDETGYSQPQVGDDFCDSLVEQVKPLVEFACGQEFQAFKCMSYSKKRKYGMNYRVKASNGFEVFHLNLYVPPKGGAPQMTAVERARREADPLNVPIDDRNFRVDLRDRRSTVFDSKPPFLSD